MNATTTFQARVAADGAAWRDPVAVLAGDQAIAEVDRRVLRSRTHGAFWETIADRGLTLLVSREYENLLVGLTVLDGRPLETHLPLPHPSGIAFDGANNEVHIAATRNPNQVITFAPLVSCRVRPELAAPPPPGRPLMPRRSLFLPGCAYLHDLAVIGGELYGNAVGENAVIRLHMAASPERVWWPRSIEHAGFPDFGRNYLQLNSIASGEDLAHSFFSATCEVPGRLRPGHLNLSVDGRGVIFSGATREVWAHGLTRPHSARLRDGELWVANSGYGELGVCNDGHFEALLALPGWTRGLWLQDDLAIIGTSRVIPRYARYAPGVDTKRSVCGVHLVDLPSGRIRGSLIWPSGNQIFAVAALPASTSTGFALPNAGRRSRRRTDRLFYSFDT